MTGTWKTGLCLLSVSVFMTACSTVPETGRRQLLLLSPAQELELGISSFTAMKQEVPISTNAAANALAQRVGQRISTVASLPNAQWEFVVFESPEANAFCLPGGKVGIYTGILPITQSEAGLATVVGHEVAHAVARHGAERVSEAMIMQVTGEVLQSSLSKSGSQTQEAAATVYGLGTQLFRALPHSRTQESEADYLGLLYMARAGYDPEEAVRFWERFAEISRKAGGATPWFLRTHPLDQTRIDQLRKWMPEAKAQMRAP